MTKYWPVYFVLSLGVGFSVAEAPAQTLEEALAAAYLNNPTLAAERSSLRQTDEGVNQAVANWRPTVSFSANYGRSAVKSFTTHTTARSQHRKPGSVALTVDQTLFRGFRTESETAEAEFSVMGDRARLADTEQTVLLDAVSAYVNVVRDQAVLKLNINNEQVLKRQLEATRDRFEVGEITRTDVHQAESRWVGATADRIQAEGNLENSRAAFVNVVGASPEDLKSTPPNVALPGGLEEAIQISFASNPNVTAAEYDEKVSREAVKQVRGELYPSVNLTGSASKNWDAGGEGTISQTFATAIELTVPIYQQGAVYSRLREAKQATAEDRMQIDQARRDAIEDTTRAWETLKTAVARIKSFNSQVNAATIALEGVEKEAAVGSRTVLDVLDAEQELLDAKVNLVRAQRDHIVAIFELRAAIGQMTARHLELPVTFYEPNAHYNEVRDRWFGGSSSGQ